MKKRDFSVWLLFLPKSVPAPYAWSIWSEIYQILEPVLDRPRGKASIDTAQTLPDGKLFGARTLQWNLPNLQKVTHDSPLTSSLSEKINFRDLEVSCPSEKKCIEEGVRPDVFVQLRKMSNNETDLINYVFEFVVAQDISDIESASTIARALTNLLRPLAVAELETPWIISRTSAGVTNKLDIIRTFFKADWNWNQTPVESMFEFSGSNFKIRSFVQLNANALEGRDG